MRVPSRNTLILKRMIDIILSGVGLVALSPLMILTALLIYISDFGPIIYKQSRIGRFNTIFKIYKFRSMCIDADQLGSFQTIDKDKRITKVGKIIRRLSIDELPQLFNVFIGDMSLVGPRPDVPMQESLYSSDEWLLRHSVRPGITGLAQATIRRMSNKNKVRKELDLIYVENISLGNDVKIIYLTFKQIFSEGGN
jgi:lipopolysaccharide/colanic/teichoic acid biosynthesis glycosyltransferase